MPYKKESPPDSYICRHVQANTPTPDAIYLSLFCQSLRGVFAALEGKLSSLVSAWKPLWKAYCKSKNIPTKRGKRGAGGAGGGSGWGRMRSHLKARGVDDGPSLPVTTRELFVSMAEADVDIEVCVAAAGSAEFIMVVDGTNCRRDILDYVLIPCHVFREGILEPPQQPGRTPKRVDCPEFPSGWLEPEAGPCSS